MRLIDADALMIKLTYSPNGVRYREFDCDNFPSTLTLRDAKKLVREEPTIGPVPDPITGLVPCGCGGQAVFEGSFLDEEVPSSYGVSLSCIECGISTIAYEYEQEAMKAWNTAMGWKGGAE